MNLVQLLLVLILVCLISGLDGKFDGREMVNGSEKNMAGREIMSKDMNANVSSLVDRISRLPLIILLSRNFAAYSSPVSLCPQADERLSPSRGTLHSAHGDVILRQRLMPPVTSLVCHRFDELYFATYRELADHQCFRIGSGE